MSDHLPKPGVELFGYTLECVLGKGGMGTVYLARQRSLDRQVAVKILHSSRLKNPASIDNFLREARNAAKLNHPNLVAVHDVHADAQLGLYCYSMEYVDGLNVSNLVVKNGPMKRSQALHITFQISKALGHAHRNELVHRDVKPDNILVTGDGTAKLLDLGLVRDRFDQPVSSADGQRILSIVGTPEYTAPEQSRNPKNAVPASDVYSLGATLYFMLTGRPPFAGETVIDLIVRAATEPVSIPPGISADCRRLLELMLAKRAAERIYDGDAVVSALQAIAAGHMPTLGPSPISDGTTTDMNPALDETFQDAETEGDLRSAAAPEHVSDGEDGEIPPETTTSGRRRLVRRRRWR